MQILIFSQAQKQHMLLGRVLSQHGMRVEYEQTNERAVNCLMTRAFAAFILVENETNERALFELVKNVRSQGCTTPIVWLSHNTSRTRGSSYLEIGVTRYVSWPYSYSYFVTELASLPQVTNINSRSLLITARFKVDTLSRTVYCDSIYIALTPKEYALQVALIKNCSRVLSKVQIWDEVWGDEAYQMNNTIEVLIRRVRKKLPDPTMIVTVAGIGYRLREDC